MSQREGDIVDMFSIAVQRDRWELLGSGKETTGWMLVVWHGEKN